MKSWKWFALKLFVGLFILPSLVAGALWGLNQNGFFNVENIELTWLESENSNLHLESQIQKLNASLEVYRGYSLWSLDLKKISSTLMQESWIEDLHLVRVWPSTLRLQLRPQKISLVYKNQSGQFFPITPQGALLDPIDLKSVPDVVLLTGEIFQKKEALRKKAVQVISEIPERGSFSRQTIAEMSYDERDGFWMELMKNHLRVKVGEDEITRKSLRVSQVVEYLKSHEFEDRVIDANLSQKVLVRLRKDP